MLIENPDALKTWLTKILQPLCDADPSTLARYVFALLKKEKTVKELKKSMNEQLQVFLVDETKPFVERLFQAIQSEEYLFTLSNQEAETHRATTLTGQSDKESTPPASQNTLETKDIIAKSINKINPSGLESPHNLTSNQIQTCSSAVTSPQSSMAFSPIKATTDKENIPRELRRRRPSARSKSRSRSRSNERMSRRSKSRDRRVVEREKQSKLHRNKSPPNLEKRKLDRKNIEDRLDHSAKNKNFNRSRSRSRSNSPEHYKVSPPLSPVRYDNKKPRCRDFDEKGYCIRGEKCLCDHGSNPVVLEGNSTLLSIPPHLREYNPDSPEIWNRGAIGNTFSGSPRASFSSNKSGVVPNAYQRAPVPGAIAGFRPTGSNFPFLINPVVAPLQRELIPVTVVDANSGPDIPVPIGGLQSKRRYDPEDSIGNEVPIKRKLPINSRLGPRVGSSSSQQNCSLELRKIPRGMNTIAHLNNHFSKFGKIVNIKISYDGDPEAAIITFSTHAEANVAYRSTEAVLNNRFIKVFWHLSGSSEASSNQNNAVAKDENQGNIRKNSLYHINNMPLVAAIAEAPKEPNSNASAENQSNSNAITKSVSSVSNTVPTTTQTATAQPLIRMKTARSIAANALIRKKQEEQAHAVVQLAHGLQKRKSELIHEYLKEMKSAVDILERMDQNDPQRNKMMETIKNLQSNIDKLNKELTSEQAQIAAHIQTQSIPVKKSKEQQKKELLDIELELIAQQQEGNDTTAIQKRLEDLQRSLGVSTQKQFSNITGNAVTRINRTRPAGPQGSTSIDRRPKTLLITGFDGEDAELLLGHFKHFGEITKHEIDKLLPQILITYATRSIAEQAAIRGQVFKDKKLKISWALPQPVIQAKQQSGEAESKITLTEKIDSDLSAEKLPELRLEDEDEDEEERSWRK